MLLLGGKCNAMSFFNLLIACKTIRQWVPHIDRQANFFYLSLQLFYALCKVFNGIQLLALRVRAPIWILFRGLAYWPARWKIVGVLQIFRQIFLEVSDRLIVLLDELWQLLDISTDGGP